MRVGVIGGQDVTQIIYILRGICSLVEYPCGMPDIITDGEPKDGLNILIVNEGNNAAGINIFMKSLTSEDVALVNADDRRIYRFLPKCPAKFITYGFSSKASVTASSVDEADGKTVQICIQRALWDYAQNTIEQQEFSVHLIDASVKIHYVLAAVTAALYMGVPPLLINEAGRF